eukprot:CAMPEP_0177633776 /NCGR_PEP_ID=MMETSP0447-20121125/3021_1 /TAXON_ID=0 /ORGANISM="Stygamoeba regulata, Strain BSH-02190019" /LENGTH=72 /DNA_ID=CAMNT_0019135465 /DNA_START=269 /DNA_END=487 /DNA_ORIENTATION=+
MGKTPSMADGFTIISTSANSEAAARTLINKEWATEDKNEKSELYEPETWQGSKRPVSEEDTTILLQKFKIEK